MKDIKTLVTIICISAGSIAAMDGSQKSENYGYYETVTKSTNIVSAKSSDKDEEVNVTKPKTVVVEKSKNTTAKDEIAKNTPSNEKIETVDHSTFDALLKAHVSSSGKVDYAAIKSKVATLDKYLGYLSQNVPGSSAGKNERLAFWINAYNANTIKLIVDNYPVASIMDLYGGKAFDKKWINIGGEKLSLNDIENNKIRAKFDEPRIHFAVNCAAKSCPPILNKAWTASNLQATLESRTIAFVNDPTYNKISSGSVLISKIFEWYAKDFPNDIVSYLTKYSNTTIDGGAKVSYIEYDWALND